MKTKGMKRSLVIVLAIALIVTAMVPITSMAGNDLKKNDLTVLKTVVNKDNVNDPYETYRFKLELDQPMSADEPDPEPVYPESGTTPGVITGYPGDVREESAIIVNNEYKDFKDISACGVQFSTDPSLKNGAENIDANGVDTPFNVFLDNLSPDTTYYYRAYGIEKDGNKQIYGMIKQFKTPAKPVVFNPTVITGDHSKVSATTADINTNSYNDFDGHHIYEVGNQYALNEDMTISSRYRASRAVVNPFDTSLTGLNSNTTYYYRAYVDTQSGTFYGEVKSFTTERGSIISSANWADFGGEAYADTVEGDYIPVDMPISEYDRLSDTGTFPDLNLKKVDTGVYTFTLKDKQSLNVNGIEENIKFKVTELGGVTDGKDVDLIDPAKRCRSFLNGEQTVYAVTDGKMSEEMDSVFIYTLPGKDGNVLGAGAGSDDDTVKGTSGSNSSVLGREAKTADMMNMMPLLIVVGLFVLFFIVISSRKESNQK